MKFNQIVKSLLLCFCSLITFAPAQPFTLEDVSDRFPSRGFEEQVRFWIAVFTEYQSNEVIFHDTEDPRLIYSRLQFERAPDGDAAEAKRQRKVLKSHVEKLQRMMDDLRRSEGGTAGLDEDQRKIVEVLRRNGCSLSPQLLKEKRETIRPQRGVRDRFEQSLIRSGRYLPWIEEALLRYGLPTELAVLPHVESSFDYNAYSHAGAAGIWQFTRGTGRAYLRVSRNLDERLDPIRATEAAAQLLAENYEVLGNWPLTITSYNYGRYGVLRAKQQYGDDLLEIIRNHETRAFGFASKNFYAEFLAALVITKNYRDYFGELPVEPPLEFDSLHLVRSTDPSHLLAIPGVTREDLVSLNPHLKRLLGSPGGLLPAGIEVRVPKGTGQAGQAALDSIKSSTRAVMVAQDGSVRYRVQPGDSLARVAREVGTSTAELTRLNGLSNPNRIYVGQLLLVRTASPLSNAAPAASGEPVLYKVQPGDNLALLSRRFGVGLDALVNENNLADPDVLAVGTVLRIPASASLKTVSRPYVVQRGDTLERIAIRFGKSVRQLQEQNEINDPNRIQPGQQILIPE